MLKVNEHILGDGYSARDASIVALILTDYGLEAEYGDPQEVSEMPETDDLKKAVAELPEMKAIIDGLQEAAEYVETLVEDLP